jgi:hypothetical protein
MKKWFGGKQVTLQGSGSEHTFKVLQAPESTESKESDM